MLRFMQPFHLLGPRCDWPECIRRSRAFYQRDDGSALALCNLHVQELVEVGEIDLYQDAHYPPYLPLVSEPTKKAS